MDTYDIRFMGSHSCWYLYMSIAFFFFLFKMKIGETIIWPITLTIKPRRINKFQAHRPTSIGFSMAGLRASPPCPLTRHWRKTCSTPLQSRCLIAMALQTSSSTHYPRGWALFLLRPHFGASSTCNSANRATFGNQVIFLIVFVNILGWRANMQVTVGEWHPKKKFVHAWSPSKRISRAWLSGEGWRCSKTDTYPKANTL